MRDTDYFDSLEERPREDDAQDVRDHIAAVLRGLRHQPRCQVTTDLLTEWKRRANYTPSAHRRES